MKQTYKITKTCFIGNKDDIVEINWDGMDGANWHNITQDTNGCPFLEMDCIEEVE